MNASARILSAAGRAAAGLLLAAGLLVAGCDSLDYEPKGAVNDSQLDTPERADQLVTAAYAALGNDYWEFPYSNMWPYGGVRSDNAYKGGGGTADQDGFDIYEQFAFVRTDQVKADQMWTRLYRAISRTNEALRRVEQFSEEEYAERTTRIAEMRFLRAHFHFLLKILFKHVPYITEDVSRDSLALVSNREYTSQELWAQIEADFRFAAENLPATQPEVGRADEFSAKAYLAKTLLYSAYEQNDQHEVVSIDQDELEEVVSLIDDIEAGGPYALADDFAQNFLWEYENGEESVFAVQRSIDDGTPDGRLDMANGLNYPMSGGFGCCWFYVPSQNLVNAFGTEEGLPDFDAFNESSFTEPADFQENTVDPRLDHTVSIPTHPFKYDPDLIYDLSWARTPEVYGPYASMKALQHPDCSCLRAVGPFYATSRNTITIRYADVLLWKAEALIELGRPDEALPLINRIRERAQRSTGRLTQADGSPTSNYDLALYEPGQNIDWTQENAREALRWERRLELAMEGYRFFDLVRWGIARETLNAYFEVEKERHEYLSNARFAEGRDEYLPIPQQQIDFSEGLYEQNPGW